MKEIANDKAAREHLIKLLNGGNAFVPIFEALEGIPFEKVAITPRNLPYNLWQQIEHLRISQKDIVDFTEGKDYKAIKWPDDYWPQKNKPANENELIESIGSIKNDHQKMIDLVKDENNPLLEPLPLGNGQTLFREAVLIAEHNAYHTGQIILMRRLLNCWK